MRIIIHRPTKMLGDLILSMPCVRAIRDHYPDAEIIGVFHPMYHKIMQRMGFFNSILSQENFQNNLLKCDMAIVFTSPFSVWAAGMFAKNKDVKLSGPQLFETKEIKDEPLATQYFIHLDNLEIPRPNYSDLSGIFSLEGKDEKLVLIHTGAGGSGKTFWPYFYYNLYDCYIKKGFDVRMILGPKEAEKAAYWKGRGVKGLEVTPDVDDLFNLILKASCYFGNDSGGTHLSALTGNLTVSMHMKDTEKRWHIIGNNAYNLLGSEQDVFNHACKFFPRSEDV